MSKHSMTTFINMGELGDQCVTVEYKTVGNDCADVRSIKWEGVEIYDELSESFIEEIADQCRDDMKEDMFAAIEQKIDEMRHPELFE